MNIMQEQVLEFHRTFGAVIQDTPGLTDADTAELRISLMQEELLGKRELAESIRNQDLVGIADGKVLKGPDFFEPDFASVIGAQA